MAVINAGWLTDFKDIKFAPKTLFSQVYVDNPETGSITDLNSYFTTFLQKLNDKDLQVDLTSNDSVKFKNPGAIGVTGILDVPNGGTGLGTVTKHALLIGNGTSALTLLPSAAGFLVSKQNGTAPLYSGIKGSWANLNSQTEGPTFYISFDGDAEATRYNMGKIPLANGSTAGVVSTSSQTFAGGKTFAAKLTAQSGIDVNSQNIENVAGMTYSDAERFYFVDKNNNTVAYVDSTGVSAINFISKNSDNTVKYDMNAEFAAVNNKINTNYTDIRGSSLYVALGTQSTTTKFSNGAIGVNGTLKVGNGGTGKSSWTANRIVYASATNALSQLEIGSSGQVLQSGGSSAAPSWITATSANTANTIVKRDSNGKFNTVYMESWAIELKPNSGVSHGGYIDFHYNGSTSDYTSRIIESSSGTITVEGNLTADAVYGAVWNDYAEYRMQTETVKPGYCVVSNNNGQVSKTTRRYQACDGIVSDTFGFAIGETDKCKTPLAVAGRVLAYCEGDRHSYQAGDTVCAGPDGKVCKMTREEIQMWPDRIVGIVSEIPEYEIWGTGNVKVNGRIWIKIK